MSSKFAKKKSKGSRSLIKVKKNKIKNDEKQNNKINGGGCKHSEGKQSEGGKVIPIGDFRLNQGNSVKATLFLDAMQFFSSFEIGHGTVIKFD